MSLSILLAARRKLAAFMCETFGHKRVPIYNYVFRGHKFTEYRCTRCNDEISMTFGLKCRGFPPPPSDLWEQP